MTRMKKSILVFAGFGALFLAGSLMESQGSKAKGGYSTPVQVMNTTSAPAIGVDAEKLARIPYESTVTGANCPAVGNEGACFYNFSAVPTGYRLVVENLAGYFQVSPTATAPVEGYLENSAFRVKNAFTAPLGQVDAGGHIQSAFNNPTRFYVDAGENVFAVTTSVWSNGNSEMILSGYLENCSITGCPAVQN